MEIKKYNKEYNSIRFESGLYCCLTQSISNCKLTIIDYISNLELTKNIYDQVFQQCRLLISVNTFRKDILEWIEKNYSVYDVSIAPVGYTGTENQYHILIKNPFSESFYSRPIPEKKEIDIIKIKENLIKAFKQKKRKTDLIEQLL